MRRRSAILGLSLLACLLWTAFVALEALHGFWRPALTGSDDSAAFLAAAHEAVPDTFRGNIVAIVLDAGDPVAEIVIGPDGAVPDRNSVLQIASFSKWVTAAWVLALVDRGVIGLNEPVEDHLARWRFPDSRYDSREVTIRRLLSHTGGLTDGLGYNGFASPADVQLLEASLGGATDAMDELVFDPIGMTASPSSTKSVEIPLN